ncbi:hypothetical protein U9M48_007694, partial [Paspalum notatum var. saurae]
MARRPRLLLLLRHLAAATALLAGFSPLAPLAEAYDPLDPTGNITVKWDIMQWTSDGYVVSCCFHIQLSKIPTYSSTRMETWVGVGTMVGGQATEQGDCSQFKGNIPHCCKRDPTVVDFLPGTPYNMQVANCCKGGVLNSWIQDPVSAISVGRSGTTNYTVKAPLNFTLKAPGPAYSCGVAHVVKPPTRFISQDGRRTTQAHGELFQHSSFRRKTIIFIYKNSLAYVTWNVTCTYSQFVAQRAPICCISLSSFYNETIVNCPKCSCGCQNNITTPGSCVDFCCEWTGQEQHGSSCTMHAPLCPIRVHWHVKINYREYWRVKITVTNWNYRMNYSQWNLVVQHPNFDKVTTIFSFNYKSLNPYGVINDTGMLWGIKYYNDLLMVAGPDGNVQSELLFRKDRSMFTFEKGWAFPRRIYFNGDSCVMPPPDAYPWLPNSSSPVLKPSSLVLRIVIWTALLA